MFSSVQRTGRDLDNRHHGLFAGLAGVQPDEIDPLARDARSRTHGRDLYDGLRLQPMHSLYDGALHGAEVMLCRDELPQWQDPQRMTGWLIYAACIHATLDEQSLPMVVSLPAGTPVDDTLVAQTEAALDRSGTSPGLLTIALGEHLVQNAGADALLTLAALRDCGTGLAVGVSEAVSGMRTLGRLPVTCLRLHPRLVQDLPDSRPARDAVERAVEIAHALNASVVGLGARTALHRDLLADLGVDAASGPVFGPPLPASIFRQALCCAVYP